VARSAAITATPLNLPPACTGRETTYRIGLFITSIKIERILPTGNLVNSGGAAYE